MSIDKGLYVVTAENDHGEISSQCNVIYSSHSDNKDTEQER